MTLRWQIVAAWCVCLLLTGCTEELPTEYGSRGVGSLRGSVNGTNVLISLLRKDDFLVTPRTRLTPRSERNTDCILWLPFGPELPTDEQRERLEQWLTAAPGRVLVYVGRDFDAAPFYWEHVLASAPVDQQLETQKRLAGARADWALWRSGFPAEEDCGWFRFTRGDQVTIGKSLAGDPRWTKGLKPERCELAIRSKLDPGFDADVLLTVDNQPVVSRQEFALETGGTSYLILVANGSFLLNLPLVNHQHRELAFRLLDEITTSHLQGLQFDQQPATLKPTEEETVRLPAGQTSPVGLARPALLQAPAAAPVATPSERLRVTLLEGNFKPDAQEPEESHSSIFQPPLSYLLLQWSLVGILLLFASWPIWGRPREYHEPHLSDFGKHVEAYGDLLRKTGDGIYAQARLREYHLHVRDGAKGERRKRSFAPTTKPPPPTTS